ncbi:MAG: hypothetical protein IJB10_04355, partial [Clostridia bacterium]|nr:hypothetical protein [Clostridia bacterium]
MSNTTHTKGNIYSLAKIAKERLKQNNYSKVKGNVINNAYTFAEYISKQKKVEKIDTKKPKTLSYDEELYKKVCDL